MTTILEGGEWSAARSGRTLPPERPGTHCTGGWVGPRAGLDRCGKSRPHRDSTLDRPAHSQSLYRLSYPTHIKATDSEFMSGSLIIQHATRVCHIILSSVTCLTALCSFTSSHKGRDFLKEVIEEHKKMVLVLSTTSA
jgi:hypothetical protein